MRLVRFEDESGGFAVDLHPLITVISGLPVHVRERLLSGVAALPNGGDPGGRGTLEVHGVFLDLNRENLELLELDQDLDVVLRSEDLPGAEPEVPQSPVASFRTPGAASAGGDRYGSSSGAGSPEQSTTQLRSAERAAQGRYGSAKAALSDLESELIEVRRERDELVDELGRQRLGTDSFAVAGLQVARQELNALLGIDDDPMDWEDLSVELDADRTADPAAAATSGDDAAGDSSDAPLDRETIEARLADLIDTSDRIKRQIRALRQVDPLPVRDAYTALELSTQTIDGPSPQAQALIDQLDEIARRRGEIEVTIGARRAELAERADVRRSVAALEPELPAEPESPPELDFALVSRLESVHDEIFELDGRSSRLLGSRHRKRLEGLRAEEAELLRKLGFSTWSNYIMGIPVEGPTAAERELDAVATHRRLLADRAESDIVVEPDPEFAFVDELDALAAEHRRLVVRAESLLQAPVGEDPREALAVHHDEFDYGAGMRPEDAASALRLALQNTGADLPAGEMTPTELLALARGWIDAMAGLSDRIAVLSEERGEIESEISALTVDLDALGGVELNMHQSAEPNSGDTETETGPETDGETAGDADSATDTPDELVGEPDPELVRQAELKVSQCEQRVAAHQAAVARISELEAQLVTLEDRIATINDALIAAETDVVRWRDEWDAAREAARQAELAASADAENDSTSGRRDPGSGDVPLWGDTSEDLTDDSTGRPGFLSGTLGGVSGGVSGGMSGGSAGAEAVEWYLLARLAQQRSVSYVGSVPLLIDDAFRRWGVDALSDVYQRLARMGEVVQIVYLTDDPEVARWAKSLGEDRALFLDTRVPG